MSWQRCRGPCLTGDHDVTAYFTQPAVPLSSRLRGRRPGASRGARRALHRLTRPRHLSPLIDGVIDSQIYLTLHNARGAVWSAMSEISGACALLYGFLAKLRGRHSY